MWYDVNKTLTHNALINIIIGPRGYGKTYALKKRAIENFIKRGQQFIYLRRFQAELDLVKEGLFNDIIVNGEFNSPVEYKENCYFYDDNLVGYAMALSRANHYKSASFPFVSTIIFDEFIIDQTQNAHYLKNEVRKLLDFIETVARMRDNIKVFLLANSLSFINPYTLYWDIKKPVNGSVSKAQNNLVLLQLVGDDEFREAKNKTLFGQLIKDSEYSDMSINNQFILDSDTFIQEKPGICRYSFTIDFKNIKYGVWNDYNNSLFYIDEHIDPSCKIIYSITIDDHNPDSILLTRSKSGPFYTLNQAFKQGLVRFSNLKTKSALMEVFKNSL